MGKIYEVRVDGLPPIRDPSDPLRFRGAEGSYFLSEEELPHARAAHPALRIVRAIDEREVPVAFAPRDPGSQWTPPPEGARLAVLARLISEGRAEADLEVRYLGRDRSVPPDGFVLDRAGGNRCYVWQVSQEARAGADLLGDFPHLRERFSDPDTRVVLALGSGGLKLFAHAVALRLLERAGCAEHIDEIWGSSGGAVVGLLYSHGLSPHAIEQTGYDLYSGRYSLPLRPSKMHVLRQLLRDALLPSPHRDAAGFVDLAQGIARMLDHYCAALRPRRPFYCVAFNLADCRPEVLTPEEVPPHLRDLLIRTDPREAALASSAVPLLFVPRRIRQGTREIAYVDGSTTEDVPLFSASRKWDLDRDAGVERRRKLLIFYVKLSGRMGQYRSHAGRVSKVRLLRMVAAAGMETMHTRDVTLLGARPDVTLIPLDLAGPSPDFFEPDRIPAFIRDAKESFPEQLAAIEEGLRQGP